MQAYGDKWSFLRLLEREPIETSFHVALTASSIIRNDVAELNRVLDQNNNPGVPSFISQYSSHFGVLPMKLPQGLGVGIYSQPLPRATARWFFPTGRVRLPGIGGHQLLRLVARIEASLRLGWSGQKIRGRTMPRPRLIRRCGARFGPVIWI